MTTLKYIVYGSTVEDLEGKVLELKASSVASGNILFIEGNVYVVDNVWFIERYEEWGVSLSMPKVIEAEVVN